MADDAPELSDSQQLEIARHLLLASPPGQFDAVLHDLRRLISESVLTDEAARSLAAEYNKRALAIAADDSHKVVLCDAGTVDANHAIASHSGAIVEVDHQLRRIRSVNEAAAASEQDAALEPQRAALAAALAEYAKQKHSHTTQYGTEAIARRGTITLVVSATKLNLRNYWASQWGSTWKLQVSGSRATLSGSAKVICHYFEDGNVQMNSERAFAQQTIDATDAAALATQVVSAIAAAEDSLHAGLRDAYRRVSGDTFKTMRRKLPLTGTRMQWNAAAHSMVRTLRK